MEFYNVPGDQGQYLMGYLQAQYYYGHPYLQNALMGMVLQMQGHMFDINSMSDTISEREHELDEREREIDQLKTRNKELEELNEALENDRIPEIQVFCLWV